MTRPIIQSGIKYGMVDDDWNGALLNQRVGKFKVDKNKMITEYLFIILQTDNYISQLKSFCDNQSHQPNVSSTQFESIKIPLPPLDVQKQIVARIEAEKKLVEANKKLIELFDGKIKAKIAEIWG